MRRNHRPGSDGSGWPLRRFVVVEESMRPALLPGDGLIAVSAGMPKVGQLRLFRDPRLSTRWLVKRVSAVRGSGRDAIFEFRSDNPGAPGAVDSHELGWVSAAGSYRVIWRVRAGSRAAG